VFERIPFKEIPEGFGILSSDFESATDNVPFWLSECIIESLIESTNRFEYLSGIICSREVIIDDNVIYNNQGVFMGEPLSKIVLVLSILALEDFVFSRYHELNPLRIYTSKDIPRAFHIGGDDHLIFGEIKYLEQIEKSSEEIGYVRSLQKSTISILGNIYTEKLLYFKGMILNMPYKEIDKNVDKSIFADSIKVRLISPFTKVLESRDDRNIAIGKSKSLASTFQYAREGYFKHICRISLQRMLQRFAPFLPKPHHKKMTAFIKLPVVLGGLGLVIDPSFNDYEKLPEIFWWAITAIAENVSYNYKVRRILSSGFQNPTAIEDIQFLKDFIDLMEDFPNLSGISFKELKDKFPEIKDNEELIEKARGDNIIPMREFLQLLDRGFKFDKIIRMKTVKQFNTKSNRKRFWEIWDKLDKYRLRVETDPQFKKIPKVIPKQSLEIVNQASKIARFDWFVQLDLMSSCMIDIVRPDKLSDEKYFELMEQEFLVPGTGIVNTDIPLKEHILYNVPELRIFHHGVEKESVLDQFIRARIKLIQEPKQE